MSIKNIDFNTQSIPADAVDFIKDSLPDLPRAAWRGLQAGAQILFSDDEEENAQIIESLVTTLKLAENMAQDFYAHKNGALPDAVYTVLAGGEELLQSPDLDQHLSAEAQDLLQEVRTLFEDPYQIQEPNTSADAKFVCGIIAYEIAEQAYEALLSGELADYEKCESPTLQGFKEYGFNPHATELETNVISLIEQVQHLHAHWGEQQYWFTGITSQPNAADLNYREIARMSGFNEKNQDVVNAFAAIDEYKNLNDPDNLPITTLAEYLETAIGPVRELRKLYPDMDETTQAALLLFQYLEDPDFQEACIELLGEVGSEAVLYSQHVIDDRIDHLQPEEQEILRDYIALASVMNLAQTLSLLADKTENSARFEEDIEAVQAYAEMMDEILENGHVFHPALKDTLDKARKGALATIAEKTGQKEALDRAVIKRIDQDPETLSSAPYANAAFIMPPNMTRQEYTEEMEGTMADNDNWLPEDFTP